jgi:hypothetical protein
MFVKRMSHNGQDVASRLTDVASGFGHFRSRCLKHGLSDLQPAFHFVVVREKSIGLSRSHIQTPSLRRGGKVARAIGPSNRLWGGHGGGVHSPGESPEDSQSRGGRGAMGTGVRRILGWAVGSSLFPTLGRQGTRGASMRTEPSTEGPPGPCHVCTYTTVERSTRPRRASQRRSRSFGVRATRFPHLEARCRWPRETGLLAHSTRSRPPSPIAVPILPPYFDAQVSCLTLSQGVLCGPGCRLCWVSWRWAHHFPLWPKRRGSPRGALAIKRLNAGPGAWAFGSTEPRAWPTRASF